MASVSAVLGAVCLWIGLRYLADNRMPDFRRNYVLYVYPDTEAGAAIDSISAGADVIREGSLVRCARKENLTERIKPGRYEIGPSMSAVYVVRMLCNGWQSPQKLTLSGTIRSRGRLASVIDRQMMVDSVTVDELRTIPLVLREKGSGTREIVENALGQHGLRVDDLNVVIELSSTEAIKSYVRNSDTMAIVSVIALHRELADGSLRIVDIDGIDMPREFATVVRPGEFSGLNARFHHFLLRTTGYNGRL